MNVCERVRANVVGNLLAAAIAAYCRGVPDGLRQDAVSGPLVALGTRMMPRDFRQRQRQNDNPPSAPLPEQKRLSRGLPHRIGDGFRMQ